MVAVLGYSITSCPVIHMDYKPFPKVELHLHLDCSLSYKVVQQLRPDISYEEYRESFVAPPKCTDLADYITRAIKGFELMQTRDQLRLVTLDLFDQLKEDNVIYAEIRFAPLLHIQGGLTAEEVVSIVNEAVGEGIRSTGVEARLILCTLRHYSEEQSMITARLAAAFKGTYVTGFDIAGDEAGFPIDAHKSAFRFIHQHQIGCTAHAGEARGADSVWETLEHFKPTRIGHGVRSAEDLGLLDHLKKEGIHLEVCVTSNVQTNLVDIAEHHKADFIYNYGVSMSINTDARTISDVTLTSEYSMMERLFQWQQSHFLHCNLEALKHAFLPEADKQSLKERLKESYGRF